VRDKEVAAVIRANQERWTPDPSTNMPKSPTLQSIEEVFRLRQAAMQAIRAADNEFFDNVEAAVLTPEQTPLLKRVRLARQRHTLNPSSSFTYSFGTASQEAGIDLSKLILRLRLDEQSAKSIDAELLNYEEAVTALFVLSYEASLETSKAQERWQIEAVKFQGEGGNPVALSQKYQDIMKEVGKKAADVRAQIAKLNRQTLEKLLAALPADKSFALRNEFNRQAYPNIFNDGSSVERHLREALKLSDLADDQRRRVSDLAAEYQPAYTNLCDQMVNLTAGSEPPDFMTGFDADAWKKYQELHEAISKLRFDRSELNQRAISQLKGILSEEQIRRLGGLPEPTKENEFEMW
jgi:hypothetical protein